MMKKVLLLTMLMVLSACGIHAQALYGKWQTKMEDKEMTADVFLTFQESGACELSFKAVVGDQEMGDIKFSAAIPGTFTRSGIELSVKLDKSSTAIQIDELNFKGQAAEMLKNPEMRKMVDSIIESELQTKKAELTRNFPENLDAEITRLDATTLELTSGGDTLTFTRAE